MSQQFYMFVYFVFNLLKFVSPLFKPYSNRANVERLFAIEFAKNRDVNYLQYINYRLPLAKRIVPKLGPNQFSGAKTMNK